MKLSLMFFSSEFKPGDTECYDLVFEASRFADQAGFHAVWLPERHFHPFGGLFPSPAVMASAIATTTEQIRLRAGSVVLPLHHPVRVAEEWAMVDQLSRGRVDLAFSKGWNPSEFIYRHNVDGYDNTVLFEEINTVRELWSGEKKVFRDASGSERVLSVYPEPVRPELAFWVSTFNGPLFDATVKQGGNILTGLLMQTVHPKFIS